MVFEYLDSPVRVYGVKLNMWTMGDNRCNMV